MNGMKEEDCTHENETENAADKVDLRETQSDSESVTLNSGAHCLRGLYQILVKKRKSRESKILREDQECDEVENGNKL